MLFNIKECKKYDAWNKVKGTSQYDAEVNYITIVNNLINKYGIN
jgi:diazepam-binding inhibitor (GABA receptor modulating acyl-CoA-binding protein)